MITAELHIHIYSVNRDTRTLIATVSATTQFGTTPRIGEACTPGVLDGVVDWFEPTITSIRHAPTLAGSDIPPQLHIEAEAQLATPLTGQVISDVTAVGWQIRTRRLRPHDDEEPPKRELTLSERIDQGVKQHRANNEAEQAARVRELADIANPNTAWLAQAVARHQQAANRQSNKPKQGRNR